MHLLEKQSCIKVLQWRNEHFIIIYILYLLTNTTYFLFFFLSYVNVGYQIHNIWPPQNNGKQQIYVAANSRMLLVLLTPPHYRHYHDPHSYFILYCNNHWSHYLYICVFIYLSVYLFFVACRSVHIFAIIIVFFVYPVIIHCFFLNFGSKNRLVTFLVAIVGCWWYCSCYCCHCVLSPKLFCIKLPF